MDVKTLSGILGHTRAAFTLDTYTHTTGDMQKRAAEIVDEFLTDIFGEELKPWQKKRKNREGTVRLRKDGRWEGRVVIGYDDQGLPKTKNVLAKTKSECVEKLKTLKDALAPPAPPRIKADMPFGDWMEHWYETYSRPAARPGTRRIYEGYLRLYIRPGLGHIPLNRLTAKDMQRFFAWLKAEGRADQSDGETGLADSQLRNIHSLCWRALEKAVSGNLIPQNPASGCKLPPARKGEMNLLSRESMQKLLIQAKEEKYYELFLLEFATGLRLGELTALQWEDLNLTTGELRISKQAVVIGSEVVVAEPKTKAAVRAPCSCRRKCWRCSESTGKGMFPDGCSRPPRRRTLLCCPRWCASGCTGCWITRAVRGCAFMICGTRMSSTRQKNIILKSRKPKLPRLWI